ncbi:MBL fold metallo-hydrolase RNA specificity domain-containing protein [Phocaeicola abscessus]|uniref:MBL fold metallo-hydrolase RNA specificity domain-containing protein n=1 Tax=Phocaeicola abscessus TaxID=555313 RepID=UPI0028E4083C|nr:MBL fold metallo-hydrolase RNA specificity domain-containing protein [Phocaeicola abscessus]
MDIKVHRGLEQIGGCITEISTATSRVFIDFGQNLPGNGKETTPEQDRLMVKNIFAANAKTHEAVFYTHGHEDHVGLFEYIPHYVPQYMSDGTKQLLLIKYGILKEGLELSLKQLKNDETCNKEQYDEAFVQKACVENKINIIAKMNSWIRTSSRKILNPISIGDITVTPFFNCHSIYDSHMFLIEADGKRIWHTGDYRAHGYMGKGLFPTLKKYATNIDTLITEGTMLNRNDECIHECKVSEKMSNVMKAFKYVFVLASATDIERLASIKNAAFEAKKSLFVCSKFLAATMKFFSERESEVSNGLFNFSPRMLRFNGLERIKRKGFVLIAGTSQTSRIEEILRVFPIEETILIYSSWEGYYTIPEQIVVNPDYKKFRELFRNVVDIHTSGHADKTTIKEIINIIKPQNTIFIHKEKGAIL